MILMGLPVVKPRNGESGSFSRDGGVSGINRVLSLTILIMVFILKVYLDETIPGFFLLNPDGFLIR